jgi:putative flippase GtrA
VYTTISKFFNNYDRRIRLIKFFFLGVINYPLNICLVWFCSEKIGIYYLQSVAIANLVIVISNYYWNRRFIFIFDNNDKVFMKYLWMVISFYFCHLILVKTLTDFLGVYYLLSVIFSITILFFLKFIIFDKYIFKNS